MTARTRWLAIVTAALASACSPKGSPAVDAKPAPAPGPTPDAASDAAGPRVEAIDAAAAFETAKSWTDDAVVVPPRVRGVVRGVPPEMPDRQGWVLHGRLRGEGARVRRR